MPKKDKCLIVAEVAQAHEGSLGIAHAFIDAIASAGADAVKFQTHIASEESTLQEEWRVKFSQQDVTRYDYWKRMDFTEEQWSGLKKHSEEKGLLFISSPFSIKAVQLLARIGIDAWKIPSGEVNNTPMFEEMAKTKLPFILSTGMSFIKEIDEAVKKVKKFNIPLTILQCTTEYPCPPEKIGLNMIPYFRQRYDCSVGLSDHSGYIYPGLAAAAIGVEMVEVHVTFSREMFGPDVKASLTIAELKQLAEGIRFIEKIKTNPVDKDIIAKDKSNLRQLFGKSIVANADLPKGKIITKEDITLKKPGKGLGVEYLDTIIGKRLKKPFKKDEFLSERDYE